MDRGAVIKQRQKRWGITDREVSQATGRPIDTIRKLGRVKFADDTLDEIEAGVEMARQTKLKTLQGAG